MIYLFGVPHSAIKEVVLGVNIEKSYENRLKEFCFNKKINLYKCKISDTKFNMERFDKILITLKSLEVTNKQTQKVGSI